MPKPGPNQEPDAQRLDAANAEYMAEQRMKLMGRLEKQTNQLKTLRSAVLAIVRDETRVRLKKSNWTFPTFRTYSDEVIRDQAAAKRVIRDVLLDDENYDTLAVAIDEDTSFSGRVKWHMHRLIWEDPDLGYRYLERHPSLKAVLEATGAQPDLSGSSSGVGLK